MQAIILAAGMGKRLGDLTRENTKCMVKVHGVTLIERMVNQLKELNLNRIIIVIGYKGEKVKKLIGDKVGQTPVCYVENNIYNKTNNIYSLYLAKELLSEDDTLLLESDLIFEDIILKKLVDNPHKNLAVVAKYQSWMDGTVVTLDDEQIILNFISKKAFLFKDKDLYFKTVNIYKFGKDFSTNKYIPFLEAYCKALGNNEYYEQVLKVISLLDKPDLKALKLDTEKWYEIDDLQDLNNAEALFSDKENALMLYGKRFGGYWRFPMLLDFCYLVNPFFPNYRLKEEMKSNFDILLTEYPSGMQINAELGARYMDLTTDKLVIGNGAAELINCYLSINQSVRTGIILPTFEEYPNRLKPEDRVYFVPSNDDFSYSASDVISFYADKSIKQLLLINPDNPSGNLLSEKDLFLLLEWTKNNNILFIVDESFLDFAIPNQSYSLFTNAILESNEHLVLIKSISKSFGVPGLRLGFLASGNKALISAIKKEISIWNINSFAEFYMQIYPKYKDDYKQACEKFIVERDRFKSNLESIPFLRVIPSAANYFLCAVNAPYTSKELCDALLLKYNILLKNCENKEGFNKKQYVRIAIRNMQDNDALIHALRQLIKD